MKNMTEEEKNWPVVAMLAGDSEVIEAVVKSASEHAGVPMNWGYIAGRAIVHSPGDRTICRSRLALAIPQSDIRDDEKFAMYLKKD